MEVTEQSSLGGQWASPSACGLPVLPTLGESDAAALCRMKVATSPLLCLNGSASHSAKLPLTAAWWGRGVRKPGLEAGHREGGLFVIQELDTFGERWWVPGHTSNCDGQGDRFLGQKLGLGRLGLVCASCLNMDHPYRSNG